ncbi:MAG: hypothetical protein PHS41_09075, partial [Victivallaceae bacterium]|nr:hypothetical protein [Victivallaceae bacterium]
MGFFQIPPRDGHPCYWLTVPATKSVTDFHRRVIAPAGHTKKKRRTQKSFASSTGAESTTPEKLLFQ